MGDVVDFFNGSTGRLVRLALGIMLIGYAWLVLGGAASAIVAIVGLVSIGLAAWGHCLLEPFVRRGAQVG
jgi:hypothetical protein